MWLSFHFPLRPPLSGLPPSLLLLLLLSCFITTQLCPNFPSLPLIASLSLFLLSIHHSRQHFLLYYLNVFPPRVSSVESLNVSCHPVLPAERLSGSFDFHLWFLLLTSCSVFHWLFRIRLNLQVDSFLSVMVSLPGKVPSYVTTEVSSSEKTSSLRRQ